MSLPGYDEWKTRNPDDDRCEFCGADPEDCRHGWRPDRCTGRCGYNWRDPDHERDCKIDERDDE